MGETYLQVQEQFLRAQGTDARRHDVYLGGIGLRASVLEAGAGEPVLVVHGGGATALVMEPLLTGLQGRFRLLAPDRPGCGATDFVDYHDVPLRAHAVAFLEGLLDHFKIARVDLLANSVGGYFSLALALDRPERVRRLVLVGAPTGLDRQVPLLIRLMGVPVLDRLLEATVARPGPALERRLFGMLVGDPSKITDDFVQVAYAQAIIPGAQRSWRSVLEEYTTIFGLNPRHDLRPELPRVTAPTLFLWGDRDYFAPPSSGERACAEMPDARIIVLPGAGHLCWIDRPDECAKAIIEFLG
jgi:pimeloyl-ACP methyl ester carboxylesterase